MVSVVEKAAPGVVKPDRLAEEDVDVDEMSHLPLRRAPLILGQLCKSELPVKHQQEILADCSWNPV